METKTTKQELVAMMTAVKNAISTMVEKALSETNLTYFVDTTEQCNPDRTTVSMAVSIMNDFNATDRFSCDLRSWETPSENMAVLVDFFARVNAAMTPKPEPEVKVETKQISVPYVIEVVEDGVRVCVGDEDFVIALQDAEGDYEWQEAVDKFGDDMPTVKQAHIIGAYHDEIQEKLKEAGGDELDGWLWTRSEYNARSAWLYYGNNGTVDGYGGKYGSCGVRPVRASNKNA